MTVIKSARYPSCGIVSALTCKAVVVQLITITDGEPTNEPEHKVFQVIKRAKDFMSQTPYGPKAIAFEFAQARTSLGRVMARQSPLLFQALARPATSGSCLEACMSVRVVHADAAY